MEIPIIFAALNTPFMRKHPAKPKYKISRLDSVGTVIFAGALSVTSLHAVDGTWLGATGNWNAGSTWSDGIIAEGTDGTANFTGVDINTDRIITLGADRTIGNITFTDATTSSNNLTISGGNILTLDRTAGIPVIDVTQADRTLTISSQISGSDGLQKNGLGTLALSGTNNYTGGTNISAGTVIASVAGSLGTGSVTNNATLNLTGGAITYTGLSTGLSGNGTVNVTLGTGSGTTTLNGNYSNFTGTWNVGIGAAAAAGKLRMDGADNAAATINVLTNATAWTSGNSVTHKASIFLNGGDTGETIGQLRVEGGATWAGTVTLAGNITGSGDNTVGAFSNFGVISGNIGETGGSRALSKGGNGTIILSGANTYTGATTVNAGTLVARSATALGTGTSANVSVVVGRALNYVAASDTALNIGGTLTINGGTGTTIGGSIGATATSARINVAGNAIATSGAVSVNVYGVAGVNRLAGTNTYTLVSGLGGGGTTLNSATYTLGNVFNNTDFTVANITKSTTGLFIDVTKQTALTTGAYFKNGGYSTLPSTWAASNGSTLSNWSTTSGGTVQGLVPGSAADVTVDSSSNAVTASVLGADMTINSLTISDNTNNFALNRDGYSLTIGSGGITKNNTTTKTASIGANIVLGAAQSWSNTDTVNALSVSGVVSGGAANTLTKTGAGTLALSGANTYTGATTVNEGVLKAGVASVANTSGAFGNNSAVTMANVASAGLDITGFNTQIGSLAGGGATGGNVTLGAATLTTGGNGTTTTYAGKISGTGGLTKIGGGTQTLTGTNDYTGATLVSGGTLAVNGSITSATTVAFGATLQGSGSIIGMLSVSGTLSAGNSIESLESGDLSLGATSDFIYEFNSALLQANPGSANEAGDLVYSSGTLSITSGAILTINDLDLSSLTQVVGTKLTLISYNGTWDDGIFQYNGADLADDTVFAVNNQNWIINYNDSFGGFNFVLDQSTGGAFVTMTAIPEPSSSLAVFGLVGATLLRRRRA